MPPSSSSLASIITAASTIHAYTEDNGTDANTFTEPHGVVAVKSVVTIVSDIIEMCLRLLNTLVAIYHIRMTMKLLSQYRYTICLGSDLLTSIVVLYHRHAPARQI